MLPNLLSNNEIKDSAGLEVEFQRLNTKDSTTEYGKVGEIPSLPLRMSVKHTETGEGINKIRRSLIRFDGSELGGVDSLKVASGSVYLVMQTPIGNLANMNLMTNLLAHMQSFVSTTGAATTVLFNGSGTGAQVLLTGSI